MPLASMTASATTAAVAAAHVSQPRRDGRARLAVPMRASSAALTSGGGTAGVSARVRRASASRESRTSVAH